MEKSSSPSFINVFKVFRSGIFLRTFSFLMGLSLAVIILFVVMIIPQEKRALMRSIESQAENLSASISEVSAKAFTSGDYTLIVDHNMQVIERSPNVLYIIVVRLDGLSLMHAKNRWEQSAKPDPAWHLQGEMKSGSIIQSKITGNNVYHYKAPLLFTGIDWGTLYIGLSLDDYKAQLKATYRMIFLLSAFCLIVAVVIAYFLARRLTFPILSLQDVTRRITAGDLAARAYIKSGDEVENLALSFNAMTDQMMDSQNKIMAAYEELEVYKNNLEELVEKRTEQVTEANKQLQEELVERRRMEEALAESEGRYRTIFETSGTANVIFDEDGIISMVNSAFGKISGYAQDEVEGKIKWTHFFNGQELKKMEHYHEVRLINPDAVPKGYEATFIDKEGKIRIVYITVSITPGTKKTIASLLDLTDLKRLEAQLLQSQKMEAIGQLAGGVAHDFNNILTAIIGYASLLRMTVEEDDPARAYVEPILTSAEKAANLTRGLLAFSRKQIIEPKAIDLNEGIRKVEHLLVRLISEDIELKTSYCEGPLTIFADIGQMEQVLINLATNARDAMPEGGFFSIETEIVMFSKGAGGDGGGDKPKKYALISISDTGGGMSKDTVEHIFEPFFTTKEIGKGTGLGLSIVYGIIKQHNGHIEVYSEIGHGTTFKIYIPLVKALTEEEQQVEQSKPRGGKETILLAEDDDITRELTRIVLEKFGYTVLEAIDGEDALEKFSMHKDRLDLIMLDVIMPKKNGKAVYEIIKTFKPDMKVLFLSGYTADIVHKKGIFEDNINFVSKPIVPDDLARKIREVLDAVEYSSE